MSNTEYSYKIYDIGKLNESYITYYITTSRKLIKEDFKIILSLLRTNDSIIKIEIGDEYLKDYVELGPIKNTLSVWSSSAKDIMDKCGLSHINKILKTESYKVFPEYYDKMTTQVYLETDKNTKLTEQDIYNISLSELEKFSEDNGLGFDKDDINYYKSIFTDRSPTNVELYDLAQSNSEHSRHWFFNGKLLNTDGTLLTNKTLFQMIKEPNKLNPSNSLVAFSDNASVIKGYKIDKFIKKSSWKSSPYILKEVELNPSLTAETHNFPTGVSPFPGAETGVGGRLRDSQAVGRGGQTVYGIAGYSVGNLHLSKYEKSYETDRSELLYASPQDILIDASNGASDYGNKYGEPIIQGYTRIYGEIFDIKTEGEIKRKNTIFKKKIQKEHYEYLKPIMFSAGISYVKTEHLYKEKSTPGLYIVRLGGKVYPIGVGGGAASSRTQDGSKVELDYSAVQRGDAQMENRLNNVIRSSINFDDNNPILSIHDQGAGGMGNVIKEIIEPYGTTLNLSKIDKSDDNMSSLNVWISEHQEQNTVLTDKKGLLKLITIANRENCPIENIGIIDSTNRIKVYGNKESEKLAVNLELDKVLTNVPQKSYKCEDYDKYISSNIRSVMSISETVKTILSHPTVSSKRYLTNKVDRSVSGLVSQQQEIGPLQQPLSDYASSALDYFTLKGTVTSIAERPVSSLIDPESMASLTLGEMLTNIMCAKISRLEDIKISTNWMWPLKHKGAKKRLYETMNYLTELLKEFKISADGGKDSLSMITKTLDNKIVISPPTLVLTSYVTTDNITQKVTPEIHENSLLFLIDLSDHNVRIGASIFETINKQLGKTTPKLEKSFIPTFKKVFKLVQKLVKTKIITAGHDRSDGGLITTLLEMAFAGNRGLDIDLTEYYMSISSSDLNDNNYMKGIEKLLYNEELGLVIEVEKANMYMLIKEFENLCISEHLIYLGKTLDKKIVNINYKVSLSDNDDEYINVINELLLNFYKEWEETSLQLSKKQTTLKCVNSERNKLHKMENLRFEYNNKVNTKLKIEHPIIESDRPKIMILRDEGSNGEREMAGSFYKAGFEPVDYNMNDLINRVKYIKKNPTGLDIFDGINGIAFVGGFSRADVFGAGNAWYNIIESNEVLKKQFDIFYNRNDTFGLGVCNGCQLMSKMGWLGDVKLERNLSEKFESRYLKVKIYNSDNIFLKDMEESIAGVYVAHGEGRFILSDKEKLKTELHPIKYVDSKNNPTEDYPTNPNGSLNGIAGVSSVNNRFLAMMPHPERTFLKWQEPYNSIDVSENKYAFWMLMFINAYNFTKSVK